MLPVEGLLRDRGVPYRLIRLKGRALSVDDVVRLSEEEVDERYVCKTVVLRGRSGRLIAVLVRGRDRVDLEAVSRVVGEEVELAPIGEMKRKSGEPGAICPLTVNVELLVDEEVLRLERMNVSSGDPHYGLELDPKHLSRLLSFKVGQFSSRPWRSRL